MTNLGVRQAVRNVERGAIRMVVFARRARYTALRPTRHEAGTGHTRIAGDEYI